MTSAPKKLDDPFVSDDEDLGMSMMHKEWSKVDGGMKNSGVRDGLESSQDCVLQGGFNTAFKEALQMAMATGRLEGGISALLSCPVPAVKQTGVPETANSPGLQHEPQLQQLLTFNSDLMAGIPALLNSAAVRNTALGVDKKASELGKTLSSFDQQMAECSVVSGSAGEDGQEKKGFVSCEDVCSNRAHFWSQLETFKSQAHTLGVLSSND